MWLDVIVALVQAIGYHYLLLLVPDIADYIIQVHQADYLTTTKKHESVAPSDHTNPLKYHAGGHFLAYSSLTRYYSWYLWSRVVLPTASSYLSLTGAEKQRSYALSILRHYLPMNRIATYVATDIIVNTTITLIYY